MKYTTIAVLTLASGSLVGLSEAQASARRTVLAPVAGRKGWYTALESIQFKRGEQIQCDADLPKALADLVETPESAQERKANKARAREQAEQAAAQAATAAEAFAQAKAKAKADAEAAANAAAEAEAKAKADAEAAALAADEAEAKAKADAEAAAAANKQKTGA
jgi:hypothetical protein